MLLGTWTGQEEKRRGVKEENRYFFDVRVDIMLTRRGNDYRFSCSSATQGMDRATQY